MRCLKLALWVAGVLIAGCGSTSHDGGSGSGGSGGAAGGGGTGNVSCSADTPVPSVQSCSDVPGSAPLPGGLCNDEGWCWENATPTGASVNGVYGFGAKDVWAVTSDGLLHFDGSQWSMADPMIQGEGMWGASPTDLWIIGPTTRHYDGKSWSIVNLPSGGQTSIHGSSADNVWSAGYEVLRFDGSAWVAPASKPPLSSFSAIWTGGPSVAWTTGYKGELYRWDGSVWTEVPTGLETAEAVWGSSASDVWVGGSTAFKPALARWDGSALTAVTLPAELDTGGRVQSIWGFGPKDVWFGLEWGSVAHYDGTSVTAVSVAWHNDTRSFWGAAPDDVWVGLESAIAHYDGKQLVSDGLVTDRSFSAIWGSAWNDVWTVGENGAALHFDGAKWSLETIGEGSFEESLSDVWGSSSCNVWALAISGKLWHFDGAGWSLAGSAAGGGATNLWGAAPAKLWAIVGGQVLRYQDGAFAPADPPAPAAVMRDVWADGQDVWTISADAVHRFDGTSWTSYPVTGSAGGADLRAVWSRGGSEVWAGGPYDVFRFDGSGFAPDAASYGALDFWGCGPSSLVATNSVVQELTSTGASSSHPGTSAYRAWGPNPNELFVIGPYGNIERRRK